MSEHNSQDPNAAGQSRRFPQRSEIHRRKREDAADQRRQQAGPNYHRDSFDSHHHRRAHDDQAANRSDTTIAGASDPHDIETELQIALPAGLPQPRQHKTRREEQNSQLGATGTRPTWQDRHRASPPPQTAPRDANQSQKNVSRDPSPTSGMQSRRIAAERARLKRRRRNSKIRTAIVLMIVMAILLGCAYLAFKVIFDRNQSVEVEDYPGPGGAAVEFVINPGDSGAVIGQNLVEADIVKSQAAFIAAWNDNANAASIQPGTYQLRKQMAAVDVVAALLDETRRTSNAVSVAPGSTVRDVADRLKSFAKFSDEQVDAAINNPTGLGLPASANGNLEGWLAPGSYEVHADDTVSDVLSRMVSSTVETLDELQVPQDQRETLLIKASILEMEVNIDRYLPQVARVIENRLDNPTGETAGFLNMDSTVNYGLGKSGGIPSGEDLRIDTPYNTYLHKGLPPTPIASPSRQAIEATLHPADGDWLYFVTVNLDTGETKFAATKAEHDANIAELTAWCEANSGKC